LKLNLYHYILFCVLLFKKFLKPNVQYFIEDGETIFFADIKAVYHVSPPEVSEIQSEISLLDLRL